MTNYKLTYYEGSGLAVPIRMAFHIGRIPFEDVRIMNDEDWDAIKPTTPLGQVPILEFDGKVVTQSNALLRYVATKAEISKGISVDDQLQIDEVCYIIDDAYGAFPKGQTTDEEKKSARSAWMSGKVTANMARIEQYIAASSSGFVSPTGLSIADLKLYGFFTLMACGYFEHVDTNLADRFPLVSKVLAKVRALPALQAYFAANPSEEAHYSQPPKQA